MLDVIVCDETEGSFFIDKCVENVPTRNSDVDYRFLEAAKAGDLETVQVRWTPGPSPATSTDTSYVLASRHTCSHCAVLQSSLPPSLSISPSLPLYPPLSLSAPPLPLSVPLGFAVLVTFVLKGELSVFVKHLSLPAAGVWSSKFFLSLSNCAALRM